MENNIHVQVPDGVLVIREGEAEKIAYKSRLKLDGTIGSVLDFVEKRKSTFEKLEAHAIFDMPARTITFVTQEQDEPGITVSGKMILHPFIGELGINIGTKTYSINALLNALKMYGRFFSTRSEHAMIVDSLSKFSAKTETEFKDSNDFKGNTAFTKITKVKHEIPLEFNLKLPIYRGMEPSEFKVDIEVLPDNGSLQCRIVSIELAEAMDTLQKEVFDQAEKELGEYLIIKK
jgi:hypothetical protein